MIRQNKKHIYGDNQPLLSPGQTFSIPFFLDGLNDSVLNFDYNDKQKVNKSALLSYFLWFQLFFIYMYDSLIYKCVIDSSVTSVAD